MNLNESADDSGKSVSGNRQMFNFIQKQTLNEDQNVVEDDAKNPSSEVLTEEKRRMQQKAGIIKS